MRIKTKITLMTFMAILLGGKVIAATPAGTLINNTAIVSYVAIGGSYIASSNTTTITVGALPNVTVSIAKSAVVKDTSGGNRIEPGSTITYTLIVTVSGSGTAAGVVITDPVPANTTYTGGTLMLNSAPLTDNPADSDGGGVAGGTVTVTLGDLTSLSPAQTITFDVTIN